MLGGATLLVYNMRYFTAIEWILSHDDFMISSQEASDKEAKFENKSNKKITEKGRWKIVNNLINKKLKNPKSVKGICSCKSDILCEHRKKYLMRSLNGKFLNR